MDREYKKPNFFLFAPKKRRFNVPEYMSINLNVAFRTFVFKALKLRQIKAIKNCLWLILVLTVSLQAAVSISHGTDEAIIWVDPPNQTVPLGELFNVTIQIDLPNLPYPNGAVGFEIGLVWDPTVLTGVNMTEVLFHSVTPEASWDNIWSIVHRINNTAGNLKYAYTFQSLTDANQGGYAPIVGNHTLAIVTFNGIRSAFSALTFMLVKIGDEAHPYTMPFMSINGTVTVGNPPPEFEVSSPVENGTYNSNSIDLAFTTSKTTSWVGYSIDEHPNITVVGNSAEIQLSDGRHTLVVYGNDTIGQMGHSIPITFVSDTLPPTVSFTFSPQPPEPEYHFGNFEWALHFDATASSDAASGIAVYDWNFGDRTNGTGVSTNHIYRDPGSYVVNLTVRDYAGNSATKTQTITINPKSLPVSLPLELLLVVLIPAVWSSALLYYFIRTSRRRKLRKVG